MNPAVVSALADRRRAGLRRAADVTVRSGAGAGLGAARSLLGAAIWREPGVVAPTKRCPIGGVASSAVSLQSAADLKASAPLAKWVHGLINGPVTLLKAPSSLSVRRV